jgi:hypothetical protein
MFHSAGIAHSDGDRGSAERGGIPTGCRPSGAPDNAAGRVQEEWGKVSSGTGWEVGDGRGIIGGMTTDHQTSRQRLIGLGVAFGVVAGIVFGAAIRNVAVGIAIGITMGTAIGAALAKKKANG